MVDFVHLKHLVIGETNEDKVEQDELQKIDTSVKVEEDKYQK